MPGARQVSKTVVPVLFNGSVGHPLDEILIIATVPGEQRKRHSWSGGL